MVLTTVEIRILSLRGAHLRAWATVVLIALTALPPVIAGLVLWLAALRYVPLTALLARNLSACARARDALEVARDRYAAALGERDARIATLTADLARARGAAGLRQETEEGRLYRQVGLHAHAPGWLIQAARRAYRSRLHPDRHPPHHRQGAHDRYVRAEDVFEKIDALRG